MPVGAGGEALGRIEAALAADDPGLADSFRRWREPGVTPVDRWTGLVLLLGLVTLATGQAGTLVVLLVVGTLGFYLVAARWACRDPSSHRGT